MNGREIEREQKVHNAHRQINGILVVVVVVVVRRSATVVFTT